MEPNQGIITFFKEIYLLFYNRVILNQNFEVSKIIDPFDCILLLLALMSILAVYYFFVDFKKEITIPPLKIAVYFIIIFLLIIASGILVYLPFKNMDILENSHMILINILKLDIVGATFITVIFILLDRVGFAFQERRDQRLGI